MNFNLSAALEASTTSYEAISTSNDSKGRPVINCKDGQTILISHLNKGVACSINGNMISAKAGCHSFIGSGGHTFFCED